ncbi:MAG: Carboxypeptidase G2 precursor [candidate division WS6 bacterium OLB20]|uniref:Carboxypeptidase G2 n=1 Tax=candidate division WS6 bacterium OLB20 TaxID=1617426 RepID=A0A136LY07_9BACT|nr:MAG: Carboxypeptidase G2 precursor [candidate division WS6 bacterium OLB20]
MLTELLSINSYTANREGVARTVSRFGQSLPEGFITETATHPDFADFTCFRTERWDSAAPRIALILHADTVFTPEQDVPVRTDGNRVYGPGASDMQASFVAVSSCLGKLAAEGALKNILVVVNTCEEKGSPAFQDQMREVAARVTHVLGFEKADDGGLPDTDPAYPREFVLASARKGIFQQTLSVHGPGGHSGALSQKSERSNAISHAVGMMADIDRLADYQAGTTINLAFVQGGRKNTVIAENCEFAFDCRYSDNIEAARVKEGIAEICSRTYVPGVKVADHGYSYDLPALPKNSGTDNLLTRAQTAGRSVGITVSARPRGGWSDVCNLYAYNPALQVIDGLGPKRRQRAFA